MKHFILHGFLLSVGMLALIAITLGALPYGGAIVFVVSALTLSGIGFFLRRNHWESVGTVLRVVGVALAFSFLASLGLGVTGSGAQVDSGLMSAAWQMMISFFLPFFWLPMVVGIFAGGVSPNSPKAEQAEDGDTSQRPC